MDLEVDLVVITTFTLTAKRAYTIADNYRKKGIYVVIGGYHASLILEEVQKYADTVFVGSAEGNWARFLIELENGNPQKVYEEIKNNHPKKEMEYDTWDFRYHNDDHSIISCIINAI